MIQKSIFCFMFVFAPVVLFSQYDKEIGVEITAASGSNLGGSVGGAIKLALVEEETIAFGPLVRFKHIWSNNIQTGFSGNRSFWGAGGYFHYRFLEWFYASAEMELNQTVNTFNNPGSNWSLAFFIGGGIHKEFKGVSLNAGLLFDVIDATRDPITQNQSPFAFDYFIERQNPNNPNQQGGGGYLPIIPRITFFFPIGRDK